MTAQIQDSFIYQAEEYALIGKNGGNLVIPDDFGMEPEMLHTACYRGFYLEYECTENTIYLQKMFVRDKNGNYPIINEIKPRIQEDEAVYEKLGLRVPFTGEIRLAKDFMPEFYVHMGFQKSSAFRKVLDLSFENGRLIQVKDRSEEMAAKRGRFKQRYQQGDLIQTINDAFSLDMDIE